MTGDWLGPETLVVPVDYATYCSAEVARDAALFVVDHREQFLANRDAGQFDGYPDPAAMMGEVLSTTAGAAPAAGPGRGDPPRDGPRGRGFGSAILAAATPASGSADRGCRAVHAARPTCSSSAPGSWARGRRSRRGAAAGRHAARRVRRGARAGDVGRPDPDQPLRPRGGRAVLALGPRLAAAGGRSRTRPARSLFREAGALWFTGEDRAFADATVPTLRALDIPVEQLTARRGPRPLAADRDGRHHGRGLRARGRAAHGRPWLRDGGATARRARGHVRDRRRPAGPGRRRPAARRRGRRRAGDGPRRRSCSRPGRGCRGCSPTSSAR